MARVLVIGDVHEPAAHPGYRAFCIDLAERWDTDRVVFIGDLLDFHAISFHPNEPDAMGPADEMDEAAIRVQAWYAAFPKAYVTIGNHDERVYRLAASVNIPGRFIRSYASLWGTRGWKWVRDCMVDGIHYLHGTGLGGQQPALTAARASMVSTVCGHVHSTAGIRWVAGPERRIFGMDTGCGVDVESPAMRYGRALVSKPILSAGVVIDGHPYHEVMPMAKGEKYHRSRFGKSA